MTITNEQAQFTPITPDIRVIQDPNFPARILTIASCNHYCYREIGMEATQIPKEQLIAMDRLWSDIPCPECESLYGVQVIERAKELLDRGWVRGVMAVTQHGCPVEGFDERSVAWSILGALQKARFDLHLKRFEAMFLCPILTKLVNGICFHALRQLANTPQQAAFLLCEWERRADTKISHLHAALDAVNRDVSGVLFLEDERKARFNAMVKERIRLRVGEVSLSEAQAAANAPPDDTDPFIQSDETPAMLAAPPAY